MPKEVHAEGKVFTFPDDATDDEIAAALDAELPATATATAEPAPSVAPRSDSIVGMFGPGASERSDAMIGAPDPTARPRMVPTGPATGPMTMREEGPPRVINDTPEQVRAGMEAAEQRRNEETVKQANAALKGLAPGSLYGRDPKDPPFTDAFEADEFLKSVERRERELAEAAEKRPSVFSGPEAALFKVGGPTAKVISNVVPGVDRIDDREYARHEEEAAYRLSGERGKDTFVGRLLSATGELAPAILATKGLGALGASGPVALGAYSAARADKGQRGQAFLTGAALGKAGEVMTSMVAASRTLARLPRWAHNVVEQVGTNVAIGAAARGGDFSQADVDGLVGFALGILSRNPQIDAGRLAARVKEFGEMRPVARARLLERYQARQDAETPKITQDAYQQQQDIETAKINAGDTRRFGNAPEPAAPEAAPEPAPPTQRRRPYRRPRPTLSQFVREAGGINPDAGATGTALRGEIARLGKKESGVPGLTRVLPGKGKAVEDMMQAARDKGFTDAEIGASPAEFLDLVYQDATGIGRIRRAADAEGDAERAQKSRDEAMQARYEEWLASDGQLEGAQDIEADVNAEWSAKAEELGRWFEEMGQLGSQPVDDPGTIPSRGASPLPPSRPAVETTEAVRPPATEAEPPRRLGGEAGFARLPDVTAPVRAVGAAVEYVKNATKQFPKTTRENREASEALSKAASSHVHAKTLRPLAERDVVKAHGLDPQEFGGALTESNLRGQKDLNTRRSLEALAEAQALRSQARTARRRAGEEGLAPLEKARRTQEANRLLEQARAAQKRGVDERARAEAIPTMIGAKDAPANLKTEQAYLEYVTRPAVKAADAAHIRFWEQNVHPMWVVRQGLEADAEVVGRGRELKGRVSVLPVSEFQKQQAAMTGDTPPTSARPGALRNKNITRSGYSNRLVGSSSGYVTDYGEIMASRIHREAFGAAKAESMKALVDAGDAEIVAPGAKAPDEIKGEPAILLTDVLPPQKGVKEGGEVVVPGVRPKSSLYVRESMAYEVKRAWKLQDPSTLGGLSKVLNPVNAASLTGLADNFVNMTRGLTTPLMRPMSSHPLRESVANLIPGFQVVRHIARTVRTVRASAKDLDAQVELAKAGAFRDYERPPVFGEKGENAALRFGVVRPFYRALQRVGNAIDRGARYQMMQVFKANARAGRWEDTPANLREYVNQMGNYVRGAQGAFVRTMVDTGLGPFTTAKVTRWGNRMRLATLDPGAKATSKGARVSDALEMLTKATGALILVGTINMTTSGNPFGRRGVPFGSIDTGEDDEHGRPKTYSFLDAVGVGDALKMFGGQAYITAKRRGLDDGNALTSALRQIANQGISFFASPAVTAGFIAQSGKNPYGYQVVPEGRPDEGVFGARAAGALFETVPPLRFLARLFAPESVEAMTRQSAEEGADWTNELRQQVSFFGTRPGMADEAVDTLPDRVRGARLNEWIDGLKRRIGNVAQPERSAWLKRQMEGLGGDEQRRVLKELRYRMAGK